MLIANCLRFIVFFVSCQLFRDCFDSFEDYFDLSKIFVRCFQYIFFVSQGEMCTSSAVNTYLATVTGKLQFGDGTASEIYGTLKQSTIYHHYD